VGAGGAGNPKRALSLADGDHAAGVRSRANCDEAREAADGSSLVRREVLPNASIAAHVAQQRSSAHDKTVSVQLLRSGELWDRFAGGVGGDQLGEVFEERAVLEAAGGGG
jgi:hypothetical protein